MKKTNFYIKLAVGLSALFLISFLSKPNLVFSRDNQFSSDSFDEWDHPQGGDQGDHGDEGEDRDHHKKLKVTKRLNPVDTSKNPKIDAVLQQMMGAPGLTRVFKATGLYHIEGTGTTAFVDVFVKTTGGEADLVSILNKVFVVNGNFVGGSVQISNLSQLEADPAVVYVQIANGAKTNLDVSRAEIRADQVAKSPKLGYQGTGVIVGAVDTGIDWTHADFTSAPNQTKILEIWDQTQTGAGVGIPSPAGFGEIYSKANINSALPGKNFGIVGETDTVGHGTHVAGIEGSTGLATNNYTGIAPKADILFVKGDFSSQARLVAGVTFILAEAANNFHEPAVVNLSLGSQFGAHDGSDSFDQSLNAWLSAHPQDAIVVAAGNEASANQHVTASVPSGSTFDIPILFQGTSAGYVAADLWFQQGANYSSVELPGLTATPLGRNLTQTLTGTLAGSPYSITLYSIGTDAQNGNDHIQLVGNFSGATGGTVALTMRVHADAAPFTTGGQFDDWITPGGGVISNFNTATITTTANRTIGIPGTSDMVFTVASYVTKAGGSTGTLGVHSVFSSEGPERPHPGNATYFGNVGVLKPDIAAPGELIASAYSTQSAPALGPLTGDGKHMLIQGTSMAAPHVAGVIALLKQSNSQLTFAQIKQVLQNTARRDTFTGGNPQLASSDNLFGYGKVDALHSVISVNPSTWQLTNFPPNTSATNPTITDIAVSPNFATDGTVFVGTLANGLWKGKVLFTGTSITMSWTQVGAPFTPTDTIGLVILPANYNDGAAGKQTVAATQETISLGQSTLFISTNGGAAWTASTAGLPAPIFVNTAAFSPAFGTTDNTIFLSLENVPSTNLYKSTNAGASWSVMGPPVVSVFAIKPSPLYSEGGANQQLMFTGEFFLSQPGIFKSTDGGSTFPTTPIVNGLPAVSGHPNAVDIRCLKTSDVVSGAFQMLIAGTGSQNITAYSFGAGNFDQPWNNLAIPNFPGAPANSEGGIDLALSSDFLKDRVMFESTDPFAPFTSKAEVFRSFDGGGTWSVDNNGFNPTLGVAVVVNKFGISTNYANDGFILAGTANYGLWMDPVGSLVAGAPSAPKISKAGSLVWGPSVITNLSVSSTTFDPSSAVPETVSFSISLPADTLLACVKDPSGKAVRKWMLNNLKAGNQSFTWDGKDGNGNILPAGQYTIVLATLRLPQFSSRAEISVTLSGNGPSAAKKASVEAGGDITPTPTLTPTPTTFPDRGLLQSAYAGPNIVRGSESTQFHFTLGAPAEVTLTIYALTGEVAFSATLQGQSGENSLTWDLKNQARQALASGVYLYQLEAVDGNGHHERRTGKIALLH